MVIFDKSKNRERSIDCPEKNKIGQKSDKKPFITTVPERNLVIW